MKKRENRKTKIKHNKPLLVVIIILVVLFILTLYLAYSPRNFECKSDEDCVLQRTTCCKCNDGGEEICMPKQNVSYYKEKIANCSGVIMCIAMFNCKYTTCKCENGKCIGIE